MDTRKLKNYLKGWKQKENENFNCYLSYNDYIITNGYSIVCLNNNYGLNIIRDKNDSLYKSLKAFRDDFKYETHLFKEINLNKEDLEKEHYDIDNDYSILISNLKKIKALIKADKIEIRTIDNRLTRQYIIEIKNTKTFEVGYLLPCRTY